MECKRCNMNVVQTVNDQCWMCRTVTNTPHKQVKQNLKEQMKDIFGEGFGDIFDNG